MLGSFLGLLGAGGSPDAGSEPSIEFNYFTITTDNSLVSNENEFLYYPLSLAPTEFWNKTKNDGGDIRVTDNEDNLIPFELFGFNKATENGHLFFRTDDLSTSVDTTYRIHFGNPDNDLLDVTDDNGRNAVWADWKAVFHLEETIQTNAVDSTGNGFEIDPQSGMVSGDSVSAKINNGWEFDGSTNDYGLLPNAHLLSPGTDDFAVVTWCKADTISGERSIFAKYGQIATNFFNLRINSSKMSVNIQVDESGSPINIADTINFVIDEYKLVAGIKDGSTGRLIIDGVERNNAALGGSTLDLTAGNNNNAGIGCWYDTGPGNLFDGIIDELMIAHFAPSEDYMLTMYNNQYVPSMFWTTSYIQGSTWLNYFTIQSNPTKVDEGIDVLMYDLSLAPASFWSKVKSDGSDIKITNNKGIDLPFELYYFDYDDNEGIIYFKTTNLSTSTNTEYRVYYNNDDPPTVLDTDSNGKYAVWDNSSYLFISHNGGIDNSKGVATSTVLGPVEGIGLNGPCAVFDGINDRIETPIATIQSPHSFLILVNPDDNTTNGMVVSNWNNGVGDTYLVKIGSQWSFHVDEGGSGTGISSATSQVDVGQWKVIVSSISSGTSPGQRILKNNTVLANVSNGATYNHNSGRPITIGDDGQAPREPFAGKIQEVWIVDTNLTDNYVKTISNCLTDNANFWITSDEMNSIPSTWNDNILISFIPNSGTLYEDDSMLVEATDDGDIIRRVVHGSITVTYGSGTNKMAIIGSTKVLHWDANGYLDTGVLQTDKVHTVFIIAKTVAKGGSQGNTMVCSSLAHNTNGMFQNFEIYANSDPSKEVTYSSLIPIDDRTAYPDVDDWEHDKWKMLGFSISSPLTESRNYRLSNRWDGNSGFWARGHLAGFMVFPYFMSKFERRKKAEQIMAEFPDLF